MNLKSNSASDEPVLQRVRCDHCSLPLVQVYQGDLLYTLQCGEEETTTQPVPAYFYRVLTDPTPLLFCPRCHATLSPATVTRVLPKALVTEEGKGTLHRGDL